jgi:hypothetical protein
MFGLNVTHAELAVRLQADAKVKEFIAGVASTTIRIEARVSPSASSREGGRIWLLTNI